MKIEILKQTNRMKWFIGSILVIAIISTITYLETRAKYRVTNSMQLASGVINYSPSDLEIVDIKLQNGDGYDNTDTVPTSGYELNTELSVCKVRETKQDVTITYENGEITINDITNKGMKCTLYFDKEKYGTGCKLILANNTEDISRATGPFASTYTVNTSGKVFSAEDDDGTTYFFAGSNPNNWVKFGANTEGQELYWRIIRVNGNGSIRLIYNGPTTDQTGETTQIGTSAFNTSYNDNAYVGYMYGSVGSSTYAETHANTNSSTIKTYLDNWYTANLKTNYEQYIDTNAGFCGDRTVDNYSGTNWNGDGTKKSQTQYGPAKRIYNTYNPTYKCSNKENDLYTWKNKSSQGNKVLDNPIGLITSDEIMYAGGYITNNVYYWLYTGQSYWTMSPYDFISSGPRVHLASSAKLGANYGNRTNGVRPVINLKTNILTLGNGTTSDPYRI